MLCSESSRGVRTGTWSRGPFGDATEKGRKRTRYISVHRIPLPGRIPTSGAPAPPSAGAPRSGSRLAWRRFAGFQYVASVRSLKSLLPIRALYLSCESTGQDTRGTATNVARCHWLRKFFGVMSSPPLRPTAGISSTVSSALPLASALTTNWFRGCPLGTNIWG
jgi:hypothetical protein